MRRGGSWYEQGPPGLTEQHWSWTWRRLAACLDVDPEIFYPENVRSAAQVCKAKVVCAGCVVREQCLEVAQVTNDNHGIWGGLTPGERQALRERRCLECDASLEGKRKDARYCSDICSTRAYYPHASERARRLLERKRRGRTCQECGGEVPVSERRQAKAKILACSDRCYQR